MYSGHRKVLLVNPNQMKPVVAPIALDYIAQGLSKCGYGADLLDLAFFNDFKNPINDYFNKPADISAVGVTVRNMDDCYLVSRDFFLPVIKNIIDYIRQKTPVPIILGGTGFSIMPRRTLDYCGADFGIWGDGEEALPGLLDNIDKPGNYPSIPGLVYRDGKNIIINEQALLDLSGFSPARDFVDNKRYLVEGGMGNFETKRGCNRQCIYCVDPLCKGRRQRLRDPSRVVDEIERLYSSGVNYFHVCDSEFNIPEVHAMELCSEIKRRGLGGRINWYAYLSPVPFSKELAIAMKQAGCCGINFGADSGNGDILKGLGRDYGPGDLVKTGAICHEQKITFMMDLLIGGPGETPDSARESIELMKKIGPQRVGLALGVRVYSGTVLARRILEQGPLTGNPGIKGKVRDNEDFFEPVFYVSPELGEDIFTLTASYVDGDERFFLPVKEAGNKNYNYNDNSILVNAIKDGYRGAFWDILRRISEGNKN